MGIVSMDVTFKTMRFNIVASALGMSRSERKIKARALEGLLSRAQGAEETEEWQQLKRG